MSTHTPHTQVNKQYRLNVRDFLRGLLIAVLTMVIGSLIEMLRKGGFEAVHIKELGVIALSSGLSYLLKNFFTATEIVVVNPPLKAVQQVKEGTPVVKVGTTTIPTNKPEDVE